MRQRGLARYFRGPWHVGAGLRRLALFQATSTKTKSHWFHGWQVRSVRGRESSKVGLLPRDTHSNPQGAFTLVTTATFLTLTSTFLDDIKEWSGPFFDAQQLGIRLNFDVDVKSAVQTDEVEVDVTQCENRFTLQENSWSPTRHGVTSHPAPKLPVGVR